MSRPRGRPAHGKGVTLDAILSTALAMLDEGEGDGLSLRALAARLGVTPMSLYHHVGDHAGLLRALSDRVYAQALEDAGDAGGAGDAGDAADHRAEIRGLLVRYYQAVARYPQLTLAIFATPESFEGVTRQITDRLTAFMTETVAAPILWRDLLIDHVHGSGLAAASARGDVAKTQRLQEQYELALDSLLNQLAV